MAVSFVWRPLGSVLASQYMDAIVSVASPLGRAQKGDMSGGFAHHSGQIVRSNEIAAPALLNRHSEPRLPQGGCGVSSARFGAPYVVSVTSA